MHADTLLSFCGKLGIQPERVMEVESPHAYSPVEHLAAQRLKKITVDYLNGLVDQFGDALSLSVGGDPGAPPLLLIREGESIKPLEDSLAAIRQRSDQLQLRFELKLDKGAVLRQYDLLDGSFDALFFVFAKRLAEWLQSPLVQLDEQLFSSAHRPMVIVVSDDDAFVQGPFLAIAGLAHMDSIRRTPPASNRDLSARVDHYLAMANENLSWLGFRFKHITPLHFLCEWTDQRTDDLHSILADHTSHLCILYTANRSSYDGRHFEATYAGSEQTAELSLVSGAGTPDGDILTRLALWPYGGRETDRLTILQSVVARELEGDSPDENYYTFVHRLGHLLREVRWHHRVFLDRTIDKHFEQIDKVTDYVAGAAKGVAQAIDSVTKGLTDALLAAVGLVVVTLLASLVKESAQVIIVQVALWAYAIYLGLFQGLYRMGCILHSYWLLRNETGQRLDTYMQRLGRERVKTLSSSLENRERQFWIWFAITGVIYVGIVALFLVLSYNLPACLAQWGAVSPAAMPVPAASPTP